MTSADLLILFRRELASCEAEIHLFPDDETVWETVPGIPNSAGTLVLHLCGNLRYFIGTVLGGTGYVRQRDLEFSRRGEARQVLIDELHLALRDVTETMTRLDQRVLDQPYSVPVGKDVRVMTGPFLMHLAVHLAYHLGQIDYVRRAVTGDGTSAGTLPLTPLALG